MGLVDNRDQVTISCINAISNPKPPEKFKGLVNFKSQKGILKYVYNEQKQVFKRYAHFRA